MPNKKEKEVTTSRHMLKQFKTIKDKNLKAFR